MWYSEKVWSALEAQKIRAQTCDSPTKNEHAKADFRLKSSDGRQKKWMTEAI
ncbi:hypothetical protein CSB96_3061 [Pseudomonas aeruginosa]|nr:hypothetical protein CSB96_3061 [Pseudomonas aeruginosa]